MMSLPKTQKKTLIFPISPRCWGAHPPPTQKATQEKRRNPIEKKLAQSGRCLESPPPLSTVHSIHHLFRGGSAGRRRSDLAHQEVAPHRQAADAHRVPQRHHVQRGEQAVRKAKGRDQAWVTCPGVVGGWVPSTFGMLRNPIAGLLGPPHATSL